MSRRLSRRLRLRIDGKEITVEIKDEVNAVRIKCCTTRLRKILNKLTYGVRVFRYYDGVYVIPEKKSGLTKLGKKIIRKYFPEYYGLANYNQIPLIILAIIVGIALYCDMAPGSSLCKGITESWWRVVLPTVALGLGIALGYRALRG